MKLRPLPSAAPPAALFGKLPCALDFVRANHDSAESIALDRWLQAALQRLTARSCPWPTGAFTFMFAIDAEHSLVGVVADSCDRAGRRFPVAVYGRVPRPPLPGAGAALVRASERFIEGAHALLAHSAELELHHVPLRLRRLFVPRARDVHAAAEEIASELTTHTLSAFASPLFSAAPAPERCARTALEQLRDRRSATGNPVECFDCPVRSFRDVAIWANWLERAHGRPSAALWAPGRDRALLAVGALPERAPLFWALPAAAHPQLCRIGEQSPSGAFHSDGDQSLAALFARLAGEPSKCARYP
jgi:type VI secretion system ImpM family protein